MVLIYSEHPLDSDNAVVPNLKTLIIYYIQECEAYRSLTTLTRVEGDWL